MRTRHDRRRMVAREDPARKRAVRGDAACARAHVLRLASREPIAVQARDQNGVGQRPPVKTFILNFKLPSER